MWKQRREQLAEKLPDNSITLFFSGRAPYKIGDEKYSFSVDRSFYYFTGLDKENMIYAMVKFAGKCLHLLFIDRYDEQLAKWIGGRILPEDAQKISGINNIYWRDEVMDILSNYLNRSFNHLTSIDVYCDFSRQEDGQNDSEALIFTKQMRKHYPNIVFHNVFGVVAKIRMIKDQEEIKKLKKAIHITKDAIENMMKHAKPGMGEYELEAYFDFILKSNNAQHSFPSIVAGGKNATILHYGENNKKIKDRSLVLCDLGASYEYLNADITRTFPINGKFTKRQREIYDIVLQGNQLIIDNAKAGMTLRQLNQMLVDFYEVKLKEINLLNHGKTVQDYYWHGVSHMLGLETHDVCIPDYPLEVGNVFTIEPGLYLEEEGIGIRIEDDVLLTEDGCINLSVDIIKTPDDIENFMAQFQK